MSSLDSLSEIVLGNLKVPSEKTEELIPFLHAIQQRYGQPIAAVHDMGAGILAAIQTVFPGVPDFICHFHFLRDLGQDLLDTDYEAMRAHEKDWELRGELALFKLMSEEQKVLFEMKDAVIEARPKRR